MPTTGTAQVSSTTTRGFYYEDTGGDLPVIVFSHGFLMDCTMFAAQVQALQGQYRCITWDQRGHGKTVAEQIYPFNFYDSANDLAGVLESLNIQSAILAGMSQGGFLTLRSALTNPGLASQLILIDTEAGVMSPGIVNGDEGLLTLWEQNGYTDKMGDLLAGQIIGPVLPGWGGLPYWENVWRDTQLADLIPCFNALIDRDDITSKIGQISQPSLVLHGEVDKSVPIADGEALASGLQNGTFVMVPGAGHASNLTHPEIVNPAIVNFLNRTVKP